MDTENLKAACAGIAAEEAFITAVAPGSIITRRINQYYPSDEAFLFAIADAMKSEYQAIVDAGFLLQLDDPQLVTRYDMEDPPPDAARLPKARRGSSRSAQPCARRTSRRSACATISAGAAGMARTRRICRSVTSSLIAPDTCRRLFDRSRQCASRTRVARVAAGQTSGRQNPHSRRGQPCDQRRRTSGAGCRAHSAFCPFSRPRERHRRYGLRPRRPAAPSTGLGKTKSFIGRRATGDAPALGALMAAERRHEN